MRSGRGWNTNITNLMEKLIWYSSEKVSRFIRDKVREITWDQNGKVLKASTVR